jgi:UDP-N-acetylglucosamine--N-acetylmuramyl-(pentapeptide) pyrophosphoryl-undecaprenol N-acetylglucosamine transferase
VYPALAIAEAIHTYHPASKLFFIGSIGGFERPLVEQGGVMFDAYDEVRAGPLHGVNPLRAIRSLFEMAAGTLSAWRLLAKHRPDVVLLTGGWVGFPAALAAWLRRTPVLIFLPDIEPALSIKVLRYFATQIALAIPESASYFAPGKTVVTGYPIRDAVESATRQDAIAHFNLDPTCQTLLVFGGSRGAHTINVALLGILPQLLADGIQVIHIGGTTTFEWLSEQASAMADHPHYHLHDYLHGPEMGLALAAADLVVSRAGAGILGEFPLFGLPSVLVPYPYAWRYQKVNADYLAERGAAVVLPDETMTTDLYPQLNALFTNTAQLATMRQQVKKLAQPGSARRLAAVLGQLAGETR